MDFLSKRRLPAILLILSAGIIVYSNTFQVPFVLDDHLNIVHNDNIHNLENFFADDSLSKRYIANLTLALNYHFGGLDVTGYHGVNLSIHLISGLLLYALLRLTFRTPYFRERDPGLENEPWKIETFVPLFAALFFVVHPVQTQAVTYIVQRMASLATMFYLLSVLLYVAARLRLEFRVQPSPCGYGQARPDSGSGRTAPVLLISCSVLSAVLAMKTKEIAFTLPLLISLYEIYFFKGKWKKRLLCLLPILATLPIVPFTVIEVGKSIREIPVGAGEPELELGTLLRADSGLSRSDYLFTQFRVIVTYLRLLILPINQNLDYEYPIYTDFFTPPVFLSFFLLAAIFALAVYLFWRSRNNGQTPSTLMTGQRLVSFGIIWFFLALSVESSLIPIFDLIVEHRLYLPCAGAAMAFTAGTFLLMEKFCEWKIGKLIPLFSLLVVLGLGIATYNRNGIWGDPVRLWQDVVSKSPAKARAHNNLGVVLTEAGRMPEAIETLRRGIALAPSHPDAYYNLGRVYYLTNRDLEAVPLLKKAIGLDLYYSEAYITLAAAFNQLRQFHKTVALLEQNLDRIGERVETHYHLGVAYAFLGNRDAARKKLAIVSGLDRAMAEDLMRLLN